MSTDKYYILVDAPPSESADDLLPPGGDAPASESGRTSASAHKTAAEASYASTEVAEKTKLNGGAALVLGGVVTLVGIPMLILPGPGLLAVGGGIALMTKGAKSLFDKRKN